MIEKIHLNEDEWFYSKMISEKYDCRIKVYTGARGCGKTQSLQDEIREAREKDELFLYMRNTEKELKTARQYFSFLATGDWFINLGSLGASTISIDNKESGEKILIGYTLWVPDYEVFKSSGRIVDNIIYEEFSRFQGGVGFNRILALTELIETISQKRPNFKFYAISNNLFYDDLFENLVDGSEFIHVHITKDVVKNNIKNEAIRRYLQGEYLLPEVTINLSRHKCDGYFMVAGTKVYIFRNENYMPNYVLSATGSGNELHIDSELVKTIRQSVYRSLRDRNKCEFVVGILLEAYKKINV